MRRRWPFTDRAVPVVAWRLLIVLMAVFAEAWNIKNMLQSGEPPTEHFAYFTVQANILVIGLFAWMLLVPEARRPRWFSHVRGAITAYIVLTGIVYAVLLAEPDEVWAWSIEFTNAAQHRFIPWMVALDWLFVPTATRITLRRAAWWMAYPVGFLVFSWLRGGLVDGWFPYPFLDPGEHGGWAGLVWPTGQVLIAFVIGIFIVAGAGRLRYRESGQAARELRAQAAPDARGASGASVASSASRASVASSAPAARAEPEPAAADDSLASSPSSTSSRP